MASTPLRPYNNVHSIHTPSPKEDPEMKESPYSPPTLRPPAARRTPSFSSSSRSNSWDSSLELSSFSFNEESPPCPYSPSTPLKFKGNIPFSWEQIPGIPKHLQQGGFKKKAESSSAMHLLPLPPAGNSNSSAKKLQNQEEISPKNYKYHMTSSRFQRDPFFAALVECSKDKDDDDDDDDGTVWKGSSKISRSLSDRFGFINMSASCKRTCTVSESIVCLPSRQTPHYLLHRRST